MSEHEDIRIIDEEAAQLLQEFVGKIENLEREKKGIMEDIREIFKQAKEENFDVATIRDILKRRKKSSQKLQEEEYLREAYEAALEKKIAADRAA